jgi:DNA-directed RNA polymerase subunit beta'
VAHVLDTIKDLGFHYGTLAGVTISKNDIVIPPDKEQILAGYEERSRALRTRTTRASSPSRSGTSRSRRSDGGDRRRRERDGRDLNELNPIYMMANSGARGSFAQLRQLAGMRA